MRPLASALIGSTALAMALGGGVPRPVLAEGAAPQAVESGASDRSSDVASALAPPEGRGLTSVIDPYEIEPTINPALAEHRDGRQVHRRILSRMRGGPASIDVSFNLSALGLDYAVPYAYDRDEICYTAAGSARMQSDGETVDFAAGLFMWRPAGAVTQRFTVTKAYNSICAFSPARPDAWSHVLPPSRIGAQGASRPRLHFRAAADVQPLPGTAGGLTHRVIFDAPAMVVSHITLTRGTRAELSQPGRDQVYFLESGALVVPTVTGPQRVAKGQFLFVPAGQRLETLPAEQDCVLIGWSAPEKG